MEAILEAVINRLNDIDCLIQETLGAGDVCYSIHSEIDSLIALIGETADSL
mgnify:CR=1 FL=1